TGKATISSTGMVTAVSDGTVTARATANDGTGIYGKLLITISNQVIPVTDITVTGSGGVNAITTHNGTLQLSASVSPANATNKTVTWSLQNGTGQATISAGGLVTAVANGTVTARATANDGTGIYGTLIINIINEIVLIESIRVYPVNNSIHIIDKKNGTLQFVAEVLPDNASNKNIYWNIENETGIAKIDSNGLVNAVSDGYVKVLAHAKDGSNVSGFCMLAIINQTIQTKLENETNNDLRVIQNQNKIVIFSNDLDNAFHFYSIFSLSGQLIRQERINGLTNYEIEISTSNLFPGFYIILLNGSRKNLSVKIIIPNSYFFF
ncbi:MAG: Ig-like domain-containing protein, partial [Bacteroidales bacterium]|nr:Ig-like domain-containing protein [Bacteroidales bacterium]